MRVMAKRDGEFYGKVFDVVSAMRHNVPPHPPVLFVLKVGIDRYIQLRWQDVIIMGKGCSL
ncbi:hypothetical protein [Bacillus wiedmannii]|uniref:hypothetical protein n=2 Tax=Bacillus wiedmannii TaxID=1890302 RepID=UPI000BF22635|nr:hypothetical protein CN672_13810 [Bacillus wiedmannii]PEM10299.1 hypothetical protein CN610_14020 [Bacillus wiedmannii]PHD09589.1 hypothetical protein COF45_18005 [Bacillus wiedmannii]